MIHNRDHEYPPLSLQQERGWPQLWKDIITRGLSFNKPQWKEWKLFSFSKLATHREIQRNFWHCRAKKKEEYMPHKYLLLLNKPHAP